MKKIATIIALVLLFSAMFYAYQTTPLASKKQMFLDTASMNTTIKPGDKMFVPEKDSIKIG